MDGNEECDTGEVQIDRSSKKHHTLWLCQQFAIEHGPFIADLPIEDGDFQ